MSRACFLKLSLGSRCRPTPLACCPVCSLSVLAEGGLYEYSGMFGVWSEAHVESNISTCGMIAWVSECGEPCGILVAPT